MKQIDKSPDIQNYKPAFGGARLAFYNTIKELEQSMTLIISRRPLTKTEHAHALTTIRQAFSDYESKMCETPAEVFSLSSRGDVPLGRDKHKSIKE